MNLQRTEEKSAKKALRKLAKKAYDEIVRVHGEMSYYSDEMYEPEIEQGGPLYQMYSDYVDKAIVEDIELQSAFKNTPPDELDQSFLRDAAGRLDRSGSRLATAA